MGMEFNNLMLPEVEQKEIKHVLACNEITCNYCITLKEEDVKRLILSRREFFKELEIIEFNEGILKKLIEVFADSPYLFQDSYADTLDFLQFVFYRFKRGSDEDMLELMRNAFDNICQGSMELLIQYFEKLEEEDRKKGIKTNDYLEPDCEYTDYTDGMYGLKDMLPILMKISRMYMDDTSLTYNDARKLMTGVSFCIRTGMYGKTNLPSDGKTDVMMFYNEGRKILNSRMVQIKEMTKQLFAIFCDYGSSFIHRSIFEEIQTDIQKLDVILAPHLLYAEPEYPVIGNIEKYDGVDKLYHYVNNIITEWRFLSEFPVLAVKELIERISAGGSDFYENLSELVLLQAVGCSIAEKDVFQLQLSLEDIDTVRMYFIGDEIKMIEKEIIKILELLFKDNMDAEYFMAAVHNIAVRVKDGIDKAVLCNVFSVTLE